MRYHWGLGVGHVGMGAVFSAEDLVANQSSQAIPAEGPGINENQTAPDVSLTSSIDLDSRDMALGVEEADGSAEDCDNGEDEDSSSSVGDGGGGPEPEDNDSHDERAELDFFDMYGDDDDWPASYN